MIGLYGLSLVTLLLLARALGVAPWEGAHLRVALEAAEAIARGQSASLVIGRAAEGGHLASLLPALPAAHAWLRLARPPHAWIDELTALRLGAIVGTATLAPLVYGLARPLGRPLALLSALIALFSPRGLEHSATLGGDGMLTVLLLGAFLAHLRAVRTRRCAPAALAGALLGLALSLSWAALLALPILLAHFMLCRAPSTRRLLRQGYAPAPLSLLAFFVVGVPCFVGVQPALWAQLGERLPALLVQAASPLVGPGLWAGRAPPPEAIPRGYALAMTLVSLPSVPGVLALVGAFFVARSRPLREEPSLALVLAVPLVFLGWPLIAPPALAAFPGPFAVALPFLSILAAVGAGSVLASAPRVAARVTPIALGVLAVGVAISAVGSPSTVSAAVPFLASGRARAGEPPTLPTQDGTAASGLTAAIDALDQPTATMYSPGVAAEGWAWLNRLGRLRTPLRLIGGAENAELLVIEGEGPTPPGTALLRRLSRGGRPVLSLYRRGPG